MPVPVAGLIAGPIAGLDPPYRGSNRMMCRTRR
jgi:hypothetical protein